jgi:hypothetical protein
MSNITERLDDALHEAYRRAYSASTPPADFDELLSRATLNEAGEKVIPYAEHVCDKETMQGILKDIYKEYKIPRIYRNSLSVNFWLGCSPNFPPPKRLNDLFTMHEPTFYVDPNEPQAKDETN